MLLLGPTWLPEDPPPQIASARPGSLRLFCVRGFIDFVLVLVLVFVFVDFAAAGVVFMPICGVLGDGVVPAVVGSIFHFSGAAAVRGPARNVVGLSGAALALAAAGDPSAVLSGRAVAGIPGPAVILFVVGPVAGVSVAAVVLFDAIVVAGVAWTAVVFPGAFVIVLVAGSANIIAGAFFVVLRTGRVRPRGSAALVRESDSGAEREHREGHGKNY